MYKEVSPSNWLIISFSLICKVWSTYYYVFYVLWVFGHNIECNLHDVRISKSTIKEYVWREKREMRIHCNIL